MIQFFLIEGGRKHRARNRFDDMVRITANIRGDDGKSGSDRLKQNRAGIFHIGRVNQKISRRQKVRDVRSATEELNAVGDPQFLCQAQVWPRLILADNNKTCLCFESGGQVRERDQCTVQPLGFKT